MAQVTPVDRLPEVRHDGQISVAVGASRKETKWKNKTLAWSELLDKLSRTTRTRETVAQYRGMPKAQQAEIKDVGGFVGGVLKGGRRKAGQVAWRSMLTLDADYAPPDLWSSIELLFGSAMAMYSTHSHTPDRPRLRLVAPLARQVSADEYKALSRFVAAEIGIDVFDDSTFEPERLMYWPSTADDGEYLFEYIDGPWLNPDDVFRRKPMWKDASTWPESSRAPKIRERHAEKQGDPTEKPGVIGAFCRAYSVTEAIDAFLPEVYTACEVPGRYTYAHGTAAAGLVVYDGDLFAFSHHGTDPASGMLCNAFDLVRIHLYGIQDEDATEDTPINKLPSFAAMAEFCLKDDAVKIELASARAAEAAEDFTHVQEAPENEDAWKAKLQYSDKGGLQQSIHNAVLILRHDPRMKGCVALDEFTRRQMLKVSAPWKQTTHPTPWVDADDSSLRHYMERMYGLTKRECIGDAVEIVMRENGFHPIREYIQGLKWDGRARIDTLLIDWLGAEDTIYTREIMRKWLVAGVARVFEPGIKFDTMLILVGAQGIGKSQFFNRLAHKTNWFSDSISKFDNSKDSMEQLAGKWIVEIGELSAMRRNEVEHVKAFLAKQEDAYRPSYGRRIENYPRQCIFGGTTNRDDFLQDATGGRRFWPIKVSNADRMWKEMTREAVEQIWAEAYSAYLMGENIARLSPEAEEIAKQKQDHYTELGGKHGVAEGFMERLLPEDWDERTIAQRREWLTGFDFGGQPTGTVKRTEISGIELFVECFNGRIEGYRKSDAHEMTDILSKLGWEKNGKFYRRRDYGKQRIFTKVERK